MTVGFLDQLGGRSLTLLTEAFEHTPIGTALVAADGSWLRVNPAAAALLGYEPAGPGGLAATDLRAVTHPDDADLDLTQRARLLAGEIPSYQVHKRFLRRDGQPIWCLLTVTTLRDGTGAAHLLYQLIDVTADRQTRELLDVMLGATPDLLMLCTVDGTVVRANAAWERALGWTAADLEGRGVLTLLHPDDVPAAREAVAQVRAGRGAATDGLRNRYRGKDGRYRWLEWSGITLPGQGLLMAVARDVSATVATEEALRRTEEQFRTAFDGSPLGLIILAEEGSFLQANAAAAALAGRSQEELVGLTYSDIIDPRDLAARADAVQGSNGDLSYDKRLLQPDGRTVWTRLTISMIPGPAGESWRLVQLADITAERAAAARAESEVQRLRATLSVQREVTAAAADRDAALRLVADRAVDLFPAADGAVVELRDGEELRSAAAAGSLAAVNAPGAPGADGGGGGGGGGGGSMINASLYADDRVIGALTVSAAGPHAFDDTDEQQLALLADSLSSALRHADDAARTATLLTERTAALAQLEQQARLLHLIPAAVIVRSLDGTVRWWNDGAETLYGWPLASAVGRTTHRLLGTVFPPGSTVQDQTDALVLDGHWDGQLQHITADGATVTVLSRQVMHRSPDGDRHSGPNSGPDSGPDTGPDSGPGGSDALGSVLEVNTDVTAFRAAELALAESEQQFRAQFTQSAAGQIIRALDGSLIDVNRAYAAMLGHTTEQLVGVRERDLLHPDDVTGMHHEIAALFAGDADSYTRQGRLRHADGHWVDVEATVSVVRAANGRPKHFIGVVTDISARRAAELARDEAAAALAERNTELERANQLKLDLIGMLGHEIGNPLASILGYSEVLTDNWQDLDAARRGRAVQGISRKAHRLDDIVREVLAMVSIDASSISARRGPNQVRAQVAVALAAMDSEHVPVLGDDVTVLVNPEHLQHMLTNLLSNAAKYGGGATAVRVAVTAHGRVQVRIEDRGPGVPDEFRPRLFQRLARAARDASSVSGTGLGLYIVRSLARANHGDVHHEPNPQGGSVFVVDLEPAPV